MYADGIFNNKHTTILTQIIAICHVKLLLCTIWFTKLHHVKVLCISKDFRDFIWTLIATPLAESMASHTERPNIVFACLEGENVK